MKKLFVCALAVLLLAGCVVESDGQAVADDVVDDVVDTPVTEEVELTDAERLGVTEVELAEIERVMKIAGWDFDREDFERIYRLKDDEMALNPAIFAEYEVTIKDGMTHNVTLNRSLVEKPED